MASGADFESLYAYLSNTKSHLISATLSCKVVEIDDLDEIHFKIKI
jgi:hypothetical protein